MIAVCVLRRDRQSTAAAAAAADVSHVLDVNDTRPDRRRAARTITVLTNRECSDQLGNESEEKERRKLKKKVQESGSPSFFIISFKVERDRG